MDGSYGNVYPSSRGMSPNVQPSNNGQYKVNVNRQKTRKWANFKPQNYDGDEWGAEDDDVEDDPEPMPPPKPMGPRHPAAHSPRSFQPVGSPPLHARNTPSPGPVSARPGSSEAISGLPSQFRGPPRSVTEPVGSPPQKSPGHALSVFPREVKRGSPAPQSAGPLPSQYPPHDADTVSSAPRQFASSSPPNNVSKPWIGARPASPQSAGPLASPNKPLPFVRPADVYRRMEEERSRSFDAGKPDVARPTTETQPQGAVQPPHTGSPAAEVWKPTGLTPVPERRSEYGIEGLVASYGSEESSVAEGQAKMGVPQKFVQPVQHDELRRFSTSPQLPNLSRMSGFGDDLFSSSFFPASGLRSPVSASMQQPASGSSAPASREFATAVAEEGPSTSIAAPCDDVADVKAKELPQNVSSLAVGTDPAMPLPETLHQDQTVGGLHGGNPSAEQPVPHAPEQQTPAADISREAALYDAGHLATRATRPSLPGAWVSETPSSAYEVGTSTPDPLAQKTPGNATGVESASPKPNLGVEPELPAVNTVKVSTPPEPETTGRSEDADLSKNRNSLPSQPGSPLAHPLRTSSPALSPALDMRSQQATTRAQDWDSPSPSKEIASSIPTGAATQHSEVTPTAPLNPRRSTHELGSIPQPVLSPPALAPGPNLEGSTDSPVKDSDLLSDEIIRSLSPVKPAGSPAEDAEEPTAAYHAAAGPTRESSYLGDVYGDYWEASAEDKADPGMLAVLRASELEKTAQEPLPPPAYEAPKEAVATPGLSIPSKSSNVQAEKVPDPGPVVTPSPGELRTRFSWEAALDSPTPPGLSTAPFTQQKSLGSGTENAAAPEVNIDTPEPKPLQLSADVAGAKSAEDLRAESAPEVSPEVHEAVQQPIMLAPVPTLEGPRDSPSPLSITTDRTKRLSMAEEKIVVNETTTPVSPPPPPLDQHPIFANTQQPREAEPPSTPTAQNIVSFRSIMEMPSPAERIKHYSDTRWQFSAVDTGLEDWLKSMLARHPEHAEAGFISPVAVPTTLQSAQGAPPAPSPGLRAPTHLHMPHQLQHLGHSSGQMGTKSKELLMAAGKAGKGFGKGLLSKGRNKLRGKGE